MSEIALFSFGSILFILTTWATLAFGLRRMHELHVRDMADMDRYPVPNPDGLTEVYVTRDELEKRRDPVAEES